jgi:predicted  nucleic acid-binding Zn-ribbon protein
MKSIISNKIITLSNEIESLMQERQAMQKRDLEVEIRIHQIVGAIYELQQLLNLESQPLEQVLESVKVE